MAVFDSEFAEEPGTSKLNQATRSASVRKVQYGALAFAAVVMTGSRVSYRVGLLLADLEVANQRPVVGIPDVRHVEMSDFDALRVQNEIQLFAGAARRIGRQSRLIDALESRRFHK